MVVVVEDCRGGGGGGVGDGGSGGRGDNGGGGRGRVGFLCIFFLVNLGQKHFFVFPKHSLYNFSACNFLRHPPPPPPPPPPTTIPFKN